MRGRYGRFILTRVQIPAGNQSISARGGYTQLRLCTTPQPWGG